MQIRKSFMPVTAAVLALCSAVSVEAAAIRTNVGFTTTLLPRNDDGSTGVVNTGINFNFYGVAGPNVFVNNNGNITFNGPFGGYVPSGLAPQTDPMIAPLWYDVDTRNPATGIVSYGTDTVNGRPAFGVNWPNVGHYSNSGPENSFQLVFIDRSDIAPGDFDFEFNYDNIVYQGGAGSGYTNGGAVDFELPGSLTASDLTNTGVNALTLNSLNSPVEGRYVFQVRNGTVAAVPDSGSTLIMLSGALMGLVSLSKKLRRHQ